MINNFPTIDLVVLTRDDRPLTTTVQASIQAQTGVKIRLHRVIGSANDQDQSRIATIVRARNEAVRRAKGPWLMFLDDDVVLEPDCVARLHYGLASRPNYAGFGADYLGEASKYGSSSHVAMGATMFRRSVLEQTTFRLEENKCECLCCCEDIRRTGARIEYLPGTKASHLVKENGRILCDQPIAVATSNKLKHDATLSTRAKILVAFNRRDVRRFREVFLRMLRAYGNQQEVIAVGYGLYPSEIGLLSRSTGVRVISKSVNGQMPPVRRLRDFGEITATLNPSASVAYWDASDIIVQASLDPLWNIVQSNPEKILGVREPIGYPQNTAIFGWTRTIQDPLMRHRAFELLSTRPFLNSGFSAGTASAMHRYFTEATRLRESSALRGSTDWGDQTAFNLYCHSDHDRWLEVPDGWNYCVHDRPAGEVHVTPDGRINCRSGTPIHVVHGNARSLVKLAIIR